VVVAHKTLARPEGMLGDLGAEPQRCAPSSAIDGVVSAAVAAGRAHALVAIVVDRGRLGDVELGADCLPRLARRAHRDDASAQVVLGRGPLVELPSGVYERHGLVELEAVLLLAPHLEAEVLAYGRVAREQALAHRTREDLG
jgi:hypothetical protein